MSTYIIEQKMSNSGTIHDIASDYYDREIIFSPGRQYAVVLASYYGGKGYTTHKSQFTACRAARRARNYSYKIIDTQGRYYSAEGDRLIPAQ